jgi:hypothetical protein
VYKPVRIKKYPNRIHLLTKERRWTYALVADRVCQLAETRGDASRTSVHEVTISRLANGRLKLNDDWMEILGQIFGVPAVEIVSDPGAKISSRIRVVFALEAGQWHSASSLPDGEQFDIMMPNDKALRDLSLYAGEIRGLSNNLRYPPETIVVLSRIEQTPGEIQVGKRYHVRVTRPDGMIEDSVKLFAQDAEGDYWLKPESDHPSHQQWVPLKGAEGLKVELIGRVRAAILRES